MSLSGFPCACAAPEDLFSYPAHEFLPLLTRMPCIDVRSPGEFLQGHIPGAYSLPLFTDAERAHVGTLYKHQGREAAFLQGLSYIGPKLSTLVQSALTLARSFKAPLAPPTMHIALHCWRGGMRSKGVASVLQAAGFTVHLLRGGYKAFRHFALDVLEKPLPLQVLGGRTGSGKTEALMILRDKGARIIDLEGLAHHRGSAFGGHEGEGQPSCELFENRLAMAIVQHMPAFLAPRRCTPQSNAVDDAGAAATADTSFHDTATPCQNVLNGTESPIWVEDESENLGTVNVPRAFYQQLRAAPLVILKTPDAARLKRVLRDYAMQSPECIGGALDRIKKRLGGLAHRDARAALAVGDLSTVATLLLAYYDRAYDKQCIQRHLYATVTADSPEDAAYQLLKAIA